ncbi:hypothetical protein RG28_27840 (plasmid) [Escherichia coli]|nr:hypothetical protein RG28_27840 [Escherichia coli]
MQKEMDYLMVLAKEMRQTRNQGKYRLNKTSRNTAKYALKPHYQEVKKHITTNNIINYKLALSESEKTCTRPTHICNPINLHALI